MHVELLCWRKPGRGPFLISFDDEDVSEDAAAIVGRLAGDADAGQGLRLDDVDALLRALADGMPHGGRIEKKCGLLGDTGKASSAGGVRKTVRLLAECFGRTLSPELLDAYEDILSGVDAGALKQAARRFMAASEGAMPTPGQLLHAVGGGPQAAFSSTKTNAAFPILGGTEPSLPAPVVEALKELMPHILSTGRMPPGVSLESRPKPEEEVRSCFEDISMMPEVPPEQGLFELFHDPEADPADGAEADEEADAAGSAH